MNCDEIVNLLVDYFDGDLSSDTARRLEEHIDCCPPCVRFIDAYRNTGKICRRALRVQMPRSVKSTLFQFLRAELQSPS